MTDSSAPMPISAAGTQVSEREAASVPPPPPPPAKPEPGKGASAKSAPPSPARKIPLWLIIAGLLFIVVATYVYIPSLYLVETDDAYVQADTISVVPKVAAYVTALHVTDNSRFSAGQLLVELDPRDFQVAVENAAANLQSAQAALVNAQAQLKEQALIIAADGANVQGDEATLTFAQQQLVRFRILAKDAAGSIENYQQAQADIGQKQAAVQKDKATLAAAETQTDVLRSQVLQADANVAMAEAGLAKARLNLSYTKIYAGISGTVANRSVQVGNFVQPGQTLFAAVPNDVYIIANYKETQLTHIKPGQPVSITVDAFPGVRLHGYVDSIQRGTGSNFALLPPENATGNFVKVVQRVPVKIILDHAEQNKAFLAPGMSVETDVNTDKPPVWLPRILLDH
jgi:membrane fusion protein (multidrug efflux system)